MFIFKSDIIIAEPYEVQIDELGNNIITMCQFIGDVHNTKVLGLERISTYVNEFFRKGEPAVNIYNYYITRKQLDQDLTTHNIYNVDKT